MERGEMGAVALGKGDREREAVGGGLAAIDMDEDVLERHDPSSCRATGSGTDHRNTLDASGIAETGPAAFGVP
ncbi:hypothetical protein STAQ_39610 [Allostella sp. ATCC 35155]|nr:hypothetical protein STAQ_39610 [Stella sp. ATCC 35155]